MGRDFNPMSSEYAANPYPTFARAREEEPVFFSPVLNGWVVTRYHEIVTVLKDFQRFSSRDAITARIQYTPEAQALLSTSLLSSTTGLGIANADPPEHTRMRARLAKAFSARRVASLEPSVRQLAVQFIEQFARNGQADFIVQFAQRYPLAVICRLMGVPHKDVEQIDRWVYDWVESLTQQQTAERQLQCVKSQLAYQQYLYDLVMQRLATPQDDLISALLSTAEEDDDHSKAVHLVGILFLLVAAGFKTTINLLGNCLAHLLRDRGNWEALCNDPTLIPAVVEETLRFDSSVLNLFRLTTQEVSLGGVTVPKGAVLYVMLASGNHDETCFPRASVFDPHRENVGQHVGFGYGIHFCIGAPLARLEMRVALEELCQRLPTLRLSPQQQFSYIPSPVAHGLQHLQLEWDK
jgi:cytochrome P450